MTYFYGRVSSKDQNLDRQIEAAHQYKRIDEVFLDKWSGKDFDRPEYKRLKSTVARGDEVVIKELDRLGRDKDGIKAEIAWFKSEGVILRILNIPTTLIDFQGQDWIADMVNNILIEVVGAMAEQEREKIRERQREGINAMPVDNEGYKVSKKTGRRFGRQEIQFDRTLLPGESISDACKRLGISRSTWYRG